MQMENSKRPIDVWLLVSCLIMLLVGLALVLVEAYAPIALPWLTTVLEGIGVGLLGTGVAGIVTAWVVSPRSSQELRRTLSEVVGSPALLLRQRSRLSELYEKKIKGAQEIDIIAMTLSAFFDNFSRDELVELVQNGRSFRLMLWSPTSRAMEIRQQEEPGANIKNDIGLAITNVKRVYDRLTEERGTGSFEVRFYETPAYHAYLRGDDEFIIGLYYHHTTGLHSECISIREKLCAEQGVADNLRKHFDALWNENQANLLCRIPARSDKEPPIFQEP